MHSNPPNLIENQTFENPRWQLAAILKIEKSQKLQNCLITCISPPELTSCSEV